MTRKDGLMIQVLLGKGFRITINEPLVKFSCLIIFTSSKIPSPFISTENKKKDKCKYKNSEKMKAFSESQNVYWKTLPQYNFSRSVLTCGKLNL